MLSPPLIKSINALENTEALRVPVVVSSLCLIQQSPNRTISVYHILIATGLMLWNTVWETLAWGFSLWSGP